MSTSRNIPSKRPRTTFLDPRKIDAALVEIAALAKHAHAPVALAGGCALQLHGSDRMTADVDVIAGADIGIRRKGPLAFGGVRATATNGTPIDVIMRSDDYTELYDAALVRAVPMRGIPIRVVTLPYLAAMKLAAGRDKNLADLAFILIDSGASYVDIRPVVRAMLGAYAARDLDTIRSEALWKRSRE